MIYLHLYLKKSSWTENVVTVLVRKKYVPSRRIFKDLSSIEIIVPRNIFDLLNNINLRNYQNTDIGNRSTCFYIISQLLIIFNANNALFSLSFISSIISRSIWFSLIAFLNSLYRLIK